MFKLKVVDNEKNIKEIYKNNEICDCDRNYDGLYQALSTNNYYFLFRYFLTMRNQ